jgi:ubiquinone/menaquinone biosynthesis C-methylase UbiE
MINNPTSFSEQAAASAFNRQAPVFDELYSSDTIILYKRKRVRDHVEKWIQPHSNILELNAGTGEDAIYFAQQGHHIHATDISEGMQEILAQKVNKKGLSEYITRELCSFTELENLAQDGPYDYIFSNFAGLNCTDRLEKVLESFNWLLKPGGYATLVVLPKFCLWEFMLLLKGRYRTAFRRFSGSKGTPAHIEGESFRCWYYNPSFITKHLPRDFRVTALEGLCSFVPPSYIENFSEKYPRLFKYLKKTEDRWKDRWPWRSIGDYFIITVRKAPEL